MSATQRPAAQRRLGRAFPLLLLLLSWLTCHTASGDVSQPRPQGYGIGDYEYDYDELPREHLRRQTRAAADASLQALEAYNQAAETLKHPAHPAQAPQQGQGHVQHVPADAPRPRQAAADSAIQRVPRVEAAAEVRAAAAEPVPAQPAQQDQAPTSAAPQPRARRQGPEEVPPTEQAPEAVPTAVPDASLTTESKEPKEDMETSNFFWGLGPVYPHLYVYRRVPHLVPLHGWSPYHAYYITHPSSR